MNKEEMSYEEYRKKWKEYPKDFQQDAVPLHLDLEVTTRCNLKCKMCYHSFDPPEPEDMDRELMKDIIREFGEKGGKSIKFCYLGETLLYPKIVEAVKFAKSVGIVDTRIATNGNLLTLKMSEELIMAGLDLIIFSVDSMVPKVYKKIRIKGDLHKVIANLALLKYLKEFHKSETPKIQVQAIPFEENRLEIESGAYKQFYKQFADVVWVGPWCLEYKDASDLGPTPNFRCPSPFQRLMVRANGDIWLCCGSQIESKYIGNYSDVNLEQVWNGDYMENVRTLMNEGKAHEIPACKECEERLMYK